MENQQIYFGKNKDKNAFEMLGLENSSNITDQQVKRAYLQLVKKYHPDVSKTGKQTRQQFIDVQAAYDLIRTQQLRQRYAQLLRNSTTTTTHHHHQSHPYHNQSSSPQDIFEWLHRQQQQSSQSWQRPGWSEFHQKTRNRFGDEWEFHQRVYRDRSSEWVEYHTRHRQRHHATPQQSVFSYYPASLIALLFRHSFSSIRALDRLQFHVPFMYEGDVTLNTTYDWSINSFPNRFRLIEQWSGFLQPNDVARSWRVIDESNHDPVGIVEHQSSSNTLSLYRCLQSQRQHDARPFHQLERSLVAKGYIKQRGSGKTLIEIRGENRSNRMATIEHYDGKEESQRRAFFKKTYQQVYDASGTLILSGYTYHLWSVATFTAWKEASKITTVKAASPWNLAPITTTIAHVVSRRVNPATFPIFFAYLTLSKRSIFKKSGLWFKTFWNIFK
mmetsp:Transcript_2499/g.3643  ORF Transcript_2499/g.3643 Transcript_2499/m.3643 type:complete len:443 (-) Transcript_2499:64-1392(-)